MPMHCPRILLMTFVLLALGSCASPDAPPHVYPGGVVPSGEVPPWPYWPTEMRIHPLTRVTEEQNELMIHVRLEFFDADGNDTRAVGQARIELRDGSLGPASDILEAWNPDLRDTAQNAVLFDKVTRTYLLRLKIDRGRLPDHAELRVYFLGIDGAELRGAHRLRLR